MGIYRIFEEGIGKTLITIMYLIFSPYAPSTSDDEKVKQCARNHCQHRQLVARALSCPAVKTRIDRH